MREKEVAVKLKHQKSNGTKEAKQRYLERAKIFKQQLQLTKEYNTITWSVKGKPDSTIIRHSTEDD